MMKRHRVTRGVCTVFAVLTVAATPALAAVEPTIADQTAVPGQSDVAVPVAITSDAAPPDQVTDMAGAFQVGANAAVDQNSDDPVVVTGIDLTGSIWSTAPGGVTSSTPGTPNEAVPVNINLVESGESVTATGELMTVRLNVADDASGTYPMKMHDIFGGNTTQFQNAQGAVPSSSTPGTLTIVPEPASATLLALGGLALLGQRRRRRNI